MNRRKFLKATAVSAASLLSMSEKSLADKKEDKVVREEFDKNGNCIYREYFDGFRLQHKYDDENNCIYSITEFNIREVHCDAIESWSEYDENGNRIYYLQSYRRFGRDPRLDRISEYDKNDNLIYTQFSNGTRCWYEYDSRGKQVASKKIIWDQIDKKEILV